MFINNVIELQTFVSLRERNKKPNTQSAFFHELTRLSVPLTGRQQFLSRTGTNGARMRALHLRRRVSLKFLCDVLCARGCLCISMSWPIPGTLVEYFISDYFDDYDGDDDDDGISIQSNRHDMNNFVYSVIIQELALHTLSQQNTFTKLCSYYVYQ